MKRFPLIAATIVALGCGNAARAELVHLLHSFEGPDVNVPKPVQFDAVGGVSVGVGNTDGSQSLFFDHTSFSPGDSARLAFAIPLNLADIEALKVTRTIRWDVTSDADPNPSDTVTGFGTWFSWNTNLTGFVSSTTFPSTFDTFFTNFVSYGSGAPGAPVTASVTVQPIVVTAMENALTGAITGSPGFVQLFFGHLFLLDETLPSPQSGPRVYVDNVRIAIPEPTAVALAVAAIGAIGARRRR